MMLETKLYFNTEKPLLDTKYGHNNLCSPVQQQFLTNDVVTKPIIIIKWETNPTLIRGIILSLQLGTEFFTKLFHVK